MRYLLISVLFLGRITLAANEDWKGASPAIEFGGGALGGMAIVGGSVGGVILGHISKKIVHRGFAPDINDQVFIEAQGGPIFADGTTYIGLSTHLRWDFHRDEDLTLYGLGGVGGFIRTSTLGRTIFFPRFGAGVMWNLEPVSLRAEISHEWTVIGASFSF